MKDIKQKALDTICSMRKGSADDRGRYEEVDYQK